MKRLLAVCLILGIADAAKADEQSTSPYATAGYFGLGSRLEVTILCPILKAAGMRIGQAVTVASIIPIRRRGAIIFRCLSYRTKIPSTTRCRTTTSHTVSSNRKRRLLSPGSSRPTQDRANQCAEIGGSPFAKAIVLATRNGKIAAPFAPTIFSTFFKVNGRSRISIMEQAWMFLPLFAIILDLHRPT